MVTNFYVSLEMELKTEVRQRFNIRSFIEIQEEYLHEDSEPLCIHPNNCVLVISCLYHCVAPVKGDSHAFIKTDPVNESH